MERRPDIGRMIEENAERSADASKPIEVPSAAKTPDWAQEKPSKDLAEQLEPFENTKEGKTAQELANMAALDVQERMQGKSAIKDIPRFKEEYLEKIREQAPGTSDAFAMKQLKEALIDAHDLRDKLGNRTLAAEIESVRRALEMLDPADTAVTSSENQAFLKRLELKDGPGAFTSPDEAKTAIAEMTTEMEARLKKNEISKEEFQQFANETMVVQKALTERFPKTIGEGKIEHTETDIDSALDDFFDQTGT